MAITRKISTVAYPASADLSGNQFMGVSMDDNGRIVANAATATPFLGVLLNKPSALNRPCEIAITGSVVKMVAGAAINERDAITGVAGGRGSPTTVANAYIVGYALSPAAASGVLFEVQVQTDRFSAA